MARKAGLDRETVLDAAERLADRDGYDALTLTALAEELGVRTPSLYAHVEGLSGLRRDLALRGALGIADAFEDAVGKRDGDEAARAVAEAFRHYARKHPGLYDAAVRAADPDDAEHAAAARQPVETVVGVLGGLGVAPSDAIHAARAWRAALHGFVTLERAHGFGLPESVEQSFDRTVDLLIAGTRATKGRRAR